MNRSKMLINEAESAFAESTKVNHSSFTSGSLGSYGWTPCCGRVSGLSFRKDSAYLVALNPRESLLNQQCIAPKCVVCWLIFDETCIHYETPETPARSLICLLYDGVAKVPYRIGSFEI